MQLVLKTASAFYCPYPITVSRFSKFSEMISDAEWKKCIIGQLCINYALHNFNTLTFDVTFVAFTNSTRYLIEPHKNSVAYIVAQRDITSFVWYHFVCGLELMIILMHLDHWTRIHSVAILSKCLEIVSNRAKYFYIHTSTWIHFCYAHKSREWMEGREAEIRE